MPISELEKKIINRIQDCVPFEHRPFAKVAFELDCSERTVLETIGRLKSEGLIRDISATFEPAAIGYQTTLAAMRIPAVELDRAADVVSSHPGVSHNYSRNHEYNLWFTLAVPISTTIEHELELLAKRAGDWPYRNFPTQKRYKIGVKFDMIEESAANVSQMQMADAIGKPDGRTIRVIRSLQEDLPLCDRPFEKIADRYGLDDTELIDTARALKRSGVIRRYGASVRHTKAGYTHNVMTVWDVVCEDLDKAGQALAELSCVSHCYSRPTYPDWPYSLFAMIHAKSEESLARFVRQAEQVVQPRKFLMLQSVREYKKKKVIYWPDESRAC